MINERKGGNGEGILTGELENGSYYQIGYEWPQVRAALAVSLSPD